MHTFVFDHMQDEAFYRYPSHYARLLRPHVDEILPRGFGAGARQLAGLLYQHGDLSQPEITMLMGHSLSKVRAIMKPMEEAGLFFIWQEGKRKKDRRYELHPDWEARLDDLRPRLPSYGQSHMLAAKTADSRAKYLDALIDDMLDGGDKDPGERRRLEARRDTYRAQKEAHRQAAQAMGLDVDARLAPPRRKVEGQDPMWRLRLRAKAHAGDDAWDRQMAVDLRVAHRQTHRRTLTITPSIPTIEDDRLMPPNWFDVLTIGTLPLPMAI